MTKKLVLAEKPSVGKDIAKILGVPQRDKNYFENEQYIITWAYGHLLSLQLPEDIKKEWQDWRLEDLPIIPKQIGLKPLPKTGGQLKLISRLAKRKDVSGAVIATDSGREGEAVARYILEWIRFDKPVERLWISSQTVKSVKEGFRQLKPARQFDALYASALARGKADWLIGLNVTRALTTKYKDSLSAGRVQTPTLAFVAAVEKQIQTFKPTTYFTVQLKIGQQKALLQAPKQFSQRKQADEFIASLQHEPGQISAVKTTQKTQAAPLPYDLTELQQIANARYGLSAKQTLALVQSLYEIHKVVSYPRTDSKYLSTDLKATMKERLEALVRFDSRAKSYLGHGAQVQQKTVFNDQKVTDHYALIPTEEAPHVERLSTDELRIYRLIVGRFMGLFAEPHVTENTNITVTFGQATFHFKQAHVLQAGWQEAASDVLQKTDKHWRVGETIRGDFQIKEQQTTAPTPLTEGNLLGKMEKYGLGTPATRAEIIEKLVKSELITRRGNSLTTTPKGQQLLKLVNTTLVSPELTGKWEQALAAIAKGSEQPQVFMTEIEQATKELVAEIKRSDVQYHDYAITNKKCPECGHALKERNTRNGRFYVCTNCDYKRRKDPKVSNHRCPQCHRKMEIIDGKQGPFFKCKFDGTTEKMLGKQDRKKKISKHEERRLLAKVNQAEEAVESPLAAALREAMSKNQ